MPETLRNVHRKFTSQRETPAAPVLRLLVDILPVFGYDKSIQKKGGCPVKKIKPNPPAPRPTPAARVRAWLRRNWLAAAVFAVCAVIFGILLVRAGEGRVFNPQVMESETLTVEKAEVVNISSDTVTVNRDNPDGRATGNQRILIRLLTGTHAGEVHELYYMVGLYVGTRVSEGDRITVFQQVDETGAIAELGFSQYDRISMVWVVTGLFLLAVLLVGGKTGLKSLLGLGVTVTALIWIFCPMWMKGADPTWLALALCVLVAVMSFLLLGGLSRKTVCAILGTVAGMGLAALFSLLAQTLFRIDSYSMYDSNPEIAELVNLQTREYPVHVHGILTAGIIIASLGAVMDVAMSLSSAIGELKTVNRGLGFRELWRSGRRIGRDMVGTMTSTLILAFVGSSLVTVLRLWGQGPGYRMLMSSRYLAVELTSAISSSVGVILAVPLTALIAALLFGREGEG